MAGCCGIHGMPTLIWALRGHKIWSRAVRIFCVYIWAAVALPISSVSATEHSCTPSPVIRTDELRAIDWFARQEIHAGKIAGAVISVGNCMRIIYHRAFGFRSLTPHRQSMRADTIFVLASLTKVVATTTAIMQLVERGKLRLDDPVAKYWPAFAAHDKSAITIKDLLTQYSGL